MAQDFAGMEGYTLQPKKERINSHPPRENKGFRQNTIHARNRRNANGRECHTFRHYTHWITETKCYPKCRGKHKKKLDEVRMPY